MIEGQRAGRTPADVGRPRPAADDDRRGTGVNIAVQAGIVVGVSVLLALLGLAAVRRLVPHETRVAHTPVAGYVYATVAVIYGVILAQVVVAAWDEYKEAGSAAEREANALVDLLRLAEGFPAAEQEAVEQALVAYARAVIDEEWPAMGREEAPSEEAKARLVDLWRAYERSEQGPAGESARFAASLDELEELDDARGARLLASRRGLPGLMWATLVVGAGLTVGFAYIFAVESRASHALMVVVLTALIALLLALVQDLNAPFRGGTRIAPDGFERVLRLAEQEAGGPFRPARWSTDVA